MAFGDQRWTGLYDAPEGLLSGWRQLAAELGGRETVAGHSVEGRPLYRFDIGPADGQPVLLTALIHGLEVIGSVALLRALASLNQHGGGREILRTLRLTVLPICNPDAYALNMERLARGLPATRRTNARGVDLNRNFPVVGRASWWNPLSGSNLRLSPWYRGPHALSEPESRTICDVAHAIRPRFSLGFHSFGNLLLYPWGFTKRANVRSDGYRRLAAGFQRAMEQERYKVRQASAFYPTTGDLDDWLDLELGALALTVEVGALDRRLWHPMRLLNPFCWMNPLDVDGAVRDLAPGLGGLLWRTVEAA